ncbi:uroporphyrinogen decarboxylase [Clostridium ragsdalei P11]|uniref:Uroporphyrinogen decarboxylase n=1 Tax=Clostridium ragsdalei P11 TaxID=1353534 RepID=A0A1A6B1P2_9CLOT|nr:uroporphyrinogen decarboxylase family protein [Clostridium ragsdalei]OBR96212.1 uroporphyrinogen decarboxylase [Clostridium ragsdalei P11]
MTPKEMTAVRDKRMLAALNMEKPDRIPIMLSGQMYFKFIDPTMTISDWWERQELVEENLIKAAQLPILDEMDSVPAATGVPMDFMQQNFAAMWFAKMKVPGHDIAKDALWQIDEQGPMTEEDYDTIINKGWGVLKQELLNRIGFDPEKLPQPDSEYMGKVNEKIAALGKTSVGMAGGLLPMPPFETLSGARKLPKFFRDLYRMPDKVRAALDIIEQEEVENTVKAIKALPGVYGFIGGTRSGCDFISPKVFEKFYFTYYQKVVPAMQANNVKTWFHMDGNWETFLPYFREFPKAQCVWDPDHVTSNIKMKEILGDKMCITGNVPPALTSVGTPEECYKYAKETIDIFGDTGFIMNSGCSVPPNAKRENIEAVILATLGQPLNK